MTRPALILRPEPGNAATAARVEAAGLDAIRLPLFAVVALPWSPPPFRDYDSLLLTSANAVRHAGDGLDALRTLPVVAVGAGTAAAARARGLDVVAVGTGDATQALALARAGDFRRVLRLAGRDRIPLAGVTDIPVYASDPIVPAPDRLAFAADGVALLHSARAAVHFAALVDRAGLPRAAIRLAALSHAVATAAGDGWAAIAVAADPTDAMLVAAARTLAIDP